MALMLQKNDDQMFSFHELEWDTEFFGVSCAKAILNQAITKFEWDELKTEFNKYQFVSIENRNSEPANAQLIGKETSAFLADVNMQFEKKLCNNFERPSGIEIHQSMDSNNQILDLIDFSFSKFIEDPGLSKRGGANVYREWIKNAFEKPDRYFAIAAGQGKVYGSLLHSYKDKTCTIELIAVASNFANKGIGSKLINAVEYEACYKGCIVLKVGTQMRNIGAINFYNKNGFKQVACHQIYHLWSI